MIFCSFIFLGTMLNISWLKYFISEPYWAGLSIVPILLIANLFLGVYYNLSIWYKLTEQTKFGALLTLIGASVTLIINFIFIPSYSYVASAWATLLSYGIMMIISYLLGKKYYPVKYNLRSMFFFFAVAMFLYLISLSYKSRFSADLAYLEILFNNLLLLFFGWLVYKIEVSRITKQNIS